MDASDDRASAAPSAGGGRPIARLQSIDALRGVAAFGVVLFHSLHKSTFVGADNWLGHALSFPLRFGFAGVYLFFVLSGFCIHLRWATSPPDAPRVQFVAFWKRRLTRLYPGYFASIWLYLAFGALLGQRVFAAPWPIDLAFHLFLLHNLTIATTYSINGVYWTLAIEEQLYLAYFAFLWMRARLSWPAILTFAMLLRVAWFGLALLLHRAFSIDIPVGEAALALWICWLFGAWSVEAWSGRTALPRALRTWPVALLALFGCVILQIIEWSTDPRSQLGHALWVLMQPAWSFAFFIGLNFVIRIGGKGLWKSAPARAWIAIGTFSYSLYLVHDLVVSMACEALGKRLFWSPGVLSAFSLVVGVPAALLFARAFFVLFERPFLSRSPRS